MTYRGSVNSLFEVVSCLFFWKTSLPELLPGKVHAGLGNAFQKVNGSFQKALDDLLADSQIPRDQLKFVIEGYSRGSLVVWMMKQLIPVTYWEAHMPHTYQELAPTAFGAAHI